LELSDELVTIRHEIDMAKGKAGIQGKDDKTPYSLDKT
jgi:hypothetical protein